VSGDNMLYNRPPAPNSGQGGLIITRELSLVHLSGL
jgi:hypothetical protein